MVELCGNIVAKRILLKMKDLDYDDKGIPDMTATAVNYILDRGKCICGADLHNNEQCRKELIDLLSYLPPESIGTQIRHLDDELKYRSTEMSKLSRFEEGNDNYNFNLDQLDEKENERIALADRIGSYKDADIIQKNYKTATLQRDQYLNEAQKFAKVEEECKKNLDSYNHQLSTASKTDDYNAAILEKMQYVRALIQKAEDQYSKNAKEIFDEVSSTLTEVFNSMYHGRRTIHLTEDYKVMLNVGGEVLDNSKGLDTVQNFAFIATLLKVAKSRKSLELGAESYPLVMDAVFSNTDDVHIRNICEELPKLSEQAILAIMDKDWVIAADSLENRVDKKYRIVKESETYSHIEELI